MVVLLTISLLIPINMQAAYGTPTSAEVQAQADEVSARLAASEAEMVIIRADYWLAVEAHDQALAGMTEAQGRIDAAQLIIQETQERLGARANQMYRQGPLSFLEVIFGASSFEEFTSTWDLINMINQENANLIQANKDARTEAQDAHDEFSAQEKIAADRQAEAAAIQARALEIIEQQQAELAGLTAEVAALVQQEEAARLAAEEAAARAAVATPGPGVSNPPPGFTAPPPPSGGYGDVVSAAASRLGCPYVYGAAGPDAFDCSGLTSWSYMQAGRGYIGRTDSSQYANAHARWPYSSGGAAPGDVLWWPGHVAIYAGGGSYIHAPLPGQVVCYSSWNIGSAVVLRF
ncbi:MAG: NlpC/P60 family protein [Coriobacteriia bacterium]|nr:NlpC/P60 family protein [Coriobacteriia bacterium]MCL2749491.1 NlpC/P60 family protein [Coriobacteriia bacterium]